MPKGGGFDRHLAQDRGGPKDRPGRHGTDRVAKAELEAERDIIEEETAPVLRELKQVKAELAALRQEITGRSLRDSHR